MSGPARIRTPDHRLRVFVSSTLKELAPERRAARAAIEQLRLAPVMFELGARPHPPADLYRAYLEQSDVFVGLYWERYGWVAPGEVVSGLEDEYIRAPEMPRLMYIKEPADAREPRLTELLTRIKTAGNTSFKTFSTTEELRELLVGDLATMLAERFDESRFVPVPPPAEPSAPADATPLPAPLTELIGRERESREIAALLERPGVRLVTLVGSGGIGKSRLAVDVATRLSRAGTPAAFVDLASVRDAALVPGAVAEALGVQDTGDVPLMDKLATALLHRELLVVIDNFEQVLEAAPLLTTLLSASPGVKFLVTSRALLRVTGEHTFEVGPLALPGAHSDVGSTSDVASVALFVERARAVKPDFDVTDDNAGALADIARALDGVPLALELAAARIRMLSPSAMLDRLDRRLPLLVGGVRDLPARQQTLRDTIEWSTDLLGQSDRDLLARLGVFAGGFSLEAAEVIAAEDGFDVLTGLAVLVDNSLVVQQDHGDRVRFGMLSTVREYAREELAASGGLERLRARHAAYFVELGDRLEVMLEGAQQGRLVAELADDRDDLRAAVRYLLDRHDWPTATRLAWSLYLYWWVGGLLGEVRGWMQEVLDADEPLPDAARATALYFIHAITFWQASDELVVPGLTESADLFHRTGDASGEALARISLALALLAAATPDPARADDELETSLDLFRSASDPWGESMALVTLGRVAILEQKVADAIDRFEETLRLTERRHDEFGTTIALHHRGWAHLLLGDGAAAAADFARSLTNSVRIGHDEGIAYGLEGLVAIAASAGDVGRAGTLLGAAEALREQTGLYNAPTFSFHRQLLAPIVGGPDAPVLEAARQMGRSMSSAAAARFALEPTS